RASTCRLLIFNPNGTILEVFLLPDWHDCFDPINRVLTRLKCDPTMWRGHDYDDTRFGDLDAANSMNNSDAIYLPALEDFPPNLSHRSQSHLRIAFVLQVQGRSALCIISGYAIKYHHRTRITLKQS